MYAIHGPNATTELAMLATLQALDAANVPALPALLSCKQGLAGAVRNSAAAAKGSGEVPAGTVTCEGTSAGGQRCTHMHGSRP